MVKIKTFNDGVIKDGTVIEAEYIDASGDAYLTAESAEMYDSRWVFKGNFSVVASSVEVSHEAGAEFALIIQVKDLPELHELLDSLPVYVVESAKLEKL